MEIEIGKHGERLRPYINLEETGIVFVRYNPNTGPHYGLYDHYPYEPCTLTSRNF